MPAAQRRIPKMFNLEHITVFTITQGFVDQGFGKVSNHGCTLISPNDEQKIKLDYNDELQYDYNVRRTFYPFAAGFYVYFNPRVTLSKVNSVGKQNDNPESIEHIANVIHQ
mgnify:CR=1 FL=1